MPDTMVQVTLPEMGESVSEGSIVEWRKKVGDFVNEGDTLVEVTTDKVDVEVPAAASGVIRQILADEGATVGVGAVLAEIDTAAKANGAAGVSAPQPAPRAAPAPPDAAVSSQPPASVAGSAEASAQARRLARKLQIDIARVNGSGPHGLVLRADVAQQGPSLPKLSDGAAAKFSMPVLPPDARIVPIKGPAAALAGYMEQSLSIPTATSFRTLSVDVLEARRKDLNAALAAAGRAQKSFVHASDRIRARAGRTGTAVHHAFVPTGK